MNEPLLEYTHVEVSYAGTAVVHDVSFPVREGEIVCIVGESGSGKSTLVKAAMGQLGPKGLVTRGDIWYQGKSVPDLPRSELQKLCGADFALVFQDCLAALTPIRTIGDQVHESLSAHRKVTRSESDDLASDMFAKLGLEDPARVLASYPFNLSGGMGQRVGIAIALLSNPRILFADEPTSALDVVVQAQVVELLRDINRKLTARQYDLALKATRPKNEDDMKEQHELWAKFDEIFLQLFPDFVEQFNGLLRPEERITLRAGEKLNTDLRIYAMVRLGINSSTKIAKILGLSTQSVYNARQKMRARATESEEEFPVRVRRLAINNSLIEGDKGMK